MLFRAFILWGARQLGSPRPPVFIQGRACPGFLSPASTKLRKGDIELPYGHLSLGLAQII